MPDARTPSRAAGVVALLVLLVHVMAAVVAITLLPRGFTLHLIQWWSNEAIPVVAIGAVVAAIVTSAWKRSWSPVGVVQAMAAGGWLAAIVVGAIAFPRSITAIRLVVPVLIALVMTALAWWARARLAWSMTGWMIEPLP